MESEMNRPDEHDPCRRRTRWAGGQELRRNKAGCEPSVRKILRAISQTCGHALDTAGNPGKTG